MLDSPPATSGFAQLVGYRLTEWREGYATIELDLGQQHMNLSGAPHGGVLATLIDTASGFAGCWCGVAGHKRRAMTLSLDTHFVGRAKPGSRLKAVARQTGGGRNIFFAMAEVRDEGGVLIAQGGGVFRYRGNSGDPRGEPSDEQHGGDPG